MKITTCAIVGVAFLISACSTTVSLYPVQGPRADSGDIRPMVATVKGIMGNSGPLTMTLPSGIKCAGRWSSAAGSGVDIGTTSLWTKYGAITGTTTMQRGSGQNPGAAVMNCDDGTLIEVEFVTGAGTASGFGVGADNHGNVFRVIL